MRILFLSEFFPSNRKEMTGGVENRVFHLAKELSNKHEVTVFSSYQEGMSKSEKIGNVTVKRFGPAFPYTTTGYLFRRAIFGIGLALRAPFLFRDFDIVDAESYFVYPAAITGRLTSKTILTYHEVWLNNWNKNTRSRFGFFGEIAERMILMGAKLLEIPIITVSEFTKKQLVKKNVSVADVIPNGIELENIKTLKKESNSICFVGRLVKHKHVDDMIFAVSILKKKGKTIKCYIVGKGSERNALENLSRSLGVNKEVEFLGYIPDFAEVKKRISSSKILIHPGTVEGFGIILIEAASLNTPYICSDIDVFKEVTLNGQGGMIFKVSDEKELSSHIETLLDDKKLYEKKQKECKNLIKRYMWKNIAESLEMVFKDV